MLQWARIIKISAMSRLTLHSFFNMIKSIKSRRKEKNIERKCEGESDDPYRCWCCSRDTGAAEKMGSRCHSWLWRYWLSGRAERCGCKSIFYILYHKKRQYLGKGKSRWNPADVYYDAFYTAVGDELSVHLMDHLYPDMLKVNDQDDIARWWEVIDRTTGEVVPPEQWSYNCETGDVTIHGAQAFHDYTVSFLAYIMWD